MLHHCDSAEQRSPTCTDTGLLDLVEVGDAPCSGCCDVLGILGCPRVRLAQVVREDGSPGLGNMLRLAERWQISVCLLDCAHTRIHAG